MLLKKVGLINVRLTAKIKIKEYHDQYLKKNPKCTFYYKESRCFRKKNNFRINAVILNYIYNINHQEQMSIVIRCSVNGV